MARLGKPIHVTEFDHRRLLSLIRLIRHRLGSSQRLFARAPEGVLRTPHDLEAKLTHAIVHPPARIPPDVVTMNSKVRVRNLASRELVALNLAFPGASKIQVPQVSVLAPMGMALLGARVQEQICVPYLDQEQRWLIEQIEYQPEAAGNFAH